MELHSSAFREGQAIPERYAHQNENVSPPLEWSDVPPDTQSLALVVEDPDAPSGTFGHWVLFNLPPDRKSLDEGASNHSKHLETAEQGLNDFGEIGYGGPQPPSGTHRYFFRLLALDTTLRAQGDPKRTDLLSAIKGHVIEESRLMGTYTKH